MSRLGAKDHPQWDDPALGAWLAQSPKHREAFAEISAIWFAAEQISLPAEELGADAPNLSAVNSRPRRWPLVGALMLALLAALGLPYLPNRWAAMQADFVTSRGQSRAITLDDGSTLQLAGNTAVSRADDGRGIELHYGEVFLDVSHDPQQPFSVRTESASVTVLGTQFGVAWRDHQHYTGVLSGRVAVKLENHPAVELGAGDMTLNGSPYGDELAARRYFSWQAGNLVFEGVPLSQVLDRLGPFLNQPVMRLPGASNPLVTAVVSVSSGEQMLETLAQSSGLTLISAGPVKLLY